MSIIKFQTSTNALSSTQNWNMQAHHWLKYYVSLRLKDRSLPRNSIQATVLMKTYLISAIWHGQDIGYIVFFVCLATLDIFGRLVSNTKIAHQINSRANSTVLIICMITWNQLTLAYFGQCFSMLSFNRWNTVHANFGYFLHFIVLAGILAAMILPKVAKTSKTEEKKE